MNNFEALNIALANMAEVEGKASVAGLIKEVASEHRTPEINRIAQGLANRVKKDQAARGVFDPKMGDNTTMEVLVKVGAFMAEVRREIA